MLLKKRPWRIDGLKSGKLADRRKLPPILRRAALAAIQNLRHVEIQLSVVPLALSSDTRSESLFSVRFACDANLLHPAPPRSPPILLLRMKSLNEVLLRQPLWEYVDSHQHDLMFATACNKYVA